MRIVESLYLGNYVAIFICDDPKPEMIKIVTDAWEKSKGMLPDIHQAVIEAAWKFGKSNDKFLSPETWLIKLQG